MLYHNVFIKSHNNQSVSSLYWDRAGNNQAYRRRLIFCSSVGHGKTQQAESVRGRQIKKQRLLCGRNPTGQSSTGMPSRTTGRVLVIPLIAIVISVGRALPNLVTLGSPREGRR